MVTLSTPWRHTTKTRNQFRESGVVVVEFIVGGVWSAYARHSAGLGATSRGAGRSESSTPVTTAGHYSNTRRIAHTRPRGPRARRTRYVPDGYPASFSDPRS